MAKEPYGRVSKTDPGAVEDQAQNSMDMLALALGQASRDPSLLAQVQLQIESRKKALSEQTMKAMEVQGQLKQESMRQAGQTQRTEAEIKGRKDIAASEETGRWQRFGTEQAGLNWRAKIGAEADVEAARIQAGAKESTDTFKMYTLAQGPIQEAKDIYLALRKGKGADLATTLVTATMAGDVAAIQAKPEKDWSKEEKATMARYQGLQGLGASGALSHEESLLKTKPWFEGAIASLPPEAQAFAQAGFTTWASGQGLLQDPNSPPPAAMPEVFRTAVTEILNPGQAPRAVVQAKVLQILNDPAFTPELQSKAMDAIMDAVLEQVQPEDMAAAQAQIQAVLADGLQVTDTDSFMSIMRDLGVQGYSPPGDIRGSRLMPRSQREKAATARKEWERKNFPNRPAHGAGGEF